MIVDSLDQLRAYTALLPRITQVADFLHSHDLAAMPAGIHHIDGDDVFVNVQDAPVKTAAEARFETHRRMVDIQVPVSGDEVHGWLPSSLLPASVYDEQTDMTLYLTLAEAEAAGLPATRYVLRKGQFAIYMPTDGHAPAITPTPMRKAIFKLRV